MSVHLASPEDSSGVSAAVGSPVAGEKMVLLLDRGIFCGGT